MSSADRFCKQFGLDQDGQNVGPDLDPNRLTSDSDGEIFLEEKSADDIKGIKKYPACRVN